MLAHFQKDGGLLLSGVLSADDLRPVEDLLLSEIRKRCHSATGIQDPAWVELAIERPDLVTEVYDAVRDHALALEIGRLPRLREAVSELIEEPLLYHKIPLRIDVPFENKELAFWHQDDFYVRGNSRELTIWIPLQDTLAHHGALSIMKGSHVDGPIAHSYQVGKKTLPVGIFDNPINIVEMRKGDALIFSSYLVHSSNLNISNQIRYSIQLRYSSARAGAQSTLMKGFSHV